MSVWDSLIKTLKQLEMFMRPMLAGITCKAKIIYFRGTGLSISILPKRGSHYVAGIGLLIERPVFL